MIVQVGGQHSGYVPAEAHEDWVELWEASEKRRLALLGRRRDAEKQGPRALTRFLGEHGMWHGSQEWVQVRVPLLTLERLVAAFPDLEE